MVHSEERPATETNRMNTQACDVVSDTGNEGAEKSRDSSDEEWCTVATGGALIPPANFGMIEKDLTRSGMPNELNFPFLERLQLRTMVYLAPDEVPPQLESFIDDQNIELLVLQPDDDEVAAQWRPISEDIVLRALGAMLDVSKYPIHIMCNGGRHRTGTVIGCVRRLQRWRLSAIFEEYQMYATAKGRLANEQFIELFDTDLVYIPPNAPSWLPTPGPP